MNPLRKLAEAGQSVWLDYIRRSLISGGELRRLVEEDGLRGVTSNPSIFEKAIAGSTDYADAIAALAGERGLDDRAAFERLALEDIRAAAAVFSPVFAATAGDDGFVSYEVAPDLAHDTTGTCVEARRLWRELALPNVMIKVPATPEGIPAIEELTVEGLNVNVTLIFSRAVYERVVEAYLRGLERRLASGGDLRSISSVASFFVSRIDTATDAAIAERLAAAAGPRERAVLQNLRGKVAVANARLAYQRWKELFGSERFRALARMGARRQRLLWASTSTKNPAYRDVMYVEELIGRDTVDTVPPATLDAFREHGRVRPSLDEDLEGAHDTLETLERTGISLEAITTRLTDDGVRLFAEAFEKLLCAVAEARRDLRPPAVGRQELRLPAPAAADVSQTLREWQSSGNAHRLWARDAGLWTGDGEAEWLGWLGITEDQRAHGDHLRRVADEVRAEGFSHALLLGMGGSSLAPEVLARTFGRQSGFPELRVLDSTDPAQIRAAEAAIDPARTLFIVSSKSGTTLEPNILKAHFFERVRGLFGHREAGRRFVAITDPGSRLEALAASDGFRRVYHGVPSIGGRYSALSDFGMVPGAAMGLDAPRLLDQAEEMAQACAGCVPARDNPGVALGVALGVLARAGRDKVTLLASPGLAALGAWLEQLLAESTGKQGKGLIPVDGERLGPPEVYGDDRVFVVLRLDGDRAGDLDRRVVALERAGHPVLRLAVADRHDIGQEFFRWEVATAVAGAVLGINPFDQPDVEASKMAARRLTAEVEAGGALPVEEPIAREDGLAAFADARNAAELAKALRRRKPTLANLLRAHLGRLGAGDYFALLAYLARDDAHEAALQAARQKVRDERRVATCLGFGPRFLHSTGQAYKGGPNSGVFLQITADAAEDLPVPGQRLTFGVVEAAQARGDLSVLAERGRRALRIHLSGDVPAGLERLRELVASAVA